MERVESSDDPRIADFVNIREARSEELFIAEGTHVVRTLVLASRFATRAILLADRLLEPMRDVLERASPATKIFVASQEVLNAIAGFDLHRGCLASGERSAIPTAEQVIADLPQDAVVLALEELANHDNVGAMFRNAAAFGASAIFLDERSADPLYRKAIRVSMGAALRVPFARVASIASLAEKFELWALTPADDAEELAPAAVPRGRLALAFGTEGTGLSAATMAAAKRRVRIDIEAGVDSINVATAAAVALHTVRSVRSVRSARSARQK